MRFTTRFVAFVTSFVGLAMVVMLIGGTLGFRQLAEDQVSHRWLTVVTVIDQALQKDEPNKLDDWLPPILAAAEVQTLTIRNAAREIYHYQAPKMSKSTTKCWCIISIRCCSIQAIRCRLAPLIRCCATPIPSPRCLRFHWLLGW